MSGHAARVQDPIEHSYADAVGNLGLAVSSVAAWFFARFSFGKTGDKADSAKMAITIVTVGTKWATRAGKLKRSSNAGHIKQGAATVGVGPKLPRAARLLDEVACASPGVAVGSAVMPQLFALRNAIEGGSVIMRWLRGMPIGPNDVIPGAHGGAKIIDGSLTVRIERRLAARVGDQTSCGGTIEKGCDLPGTVVWIGGPTARLKGESASETQEIDAILAFLSYVKVLLGFWDAPKGKVKGGPDVIIATAKAAAKVWKDATGSLAAKEFEAGIDIIDTRYSFFKAKSPEDFFKANEKVATVAERGTDAAGSQSTPPYEYDPATDSSSPHG